MTQGIDRFRNDALRCLLTTRIDVLTALVKDQQANCGRLSHTPEVFFNVLQGARLVQTAKQLKIVDEADDALKSGHSSHFRS